MTKAITNQDIFELLQDFMQMTSERFDRLEAQIDRMIITSHEVKAAREFTIRIDSAAQQPENVNINKTN